MEDANHFFTSENFDHITALVIEYGLAVILAVVVLIVGLMVVRWMVKTADKIMVKRNVDASLRPFLRTVINALLRVVLVISVIGMVGIQTTSLIAVLGAAGLAIGMALSGTLQNFAGGVIVLILKPFKVGDFIEAASHSGTVREIQVFYTYLTTPTGQEIIVPNAELSNNSIVNYSINPTRRLDLTFRVPYGDDYEKAKSILEELGRAENRFIESEGVNVFVEELADSTVNLRLRAWTLSSDYWDIHNNMPEKVRKAFDSAGLNPPIPKSDVHLHPEKRAS